MELTGITRSIPLIFHFPDREGGGSTPPAAQDRVSVNIFPQMDVEEAESVFNDTLNMITTDTVTALSAHSGLVPERVFALLGM
jgi:hypothetical protein